MSREFTRNWKEKEKKKTPRELAPDQTKFWAWEYKDYFSVNKF